MSDLTEKLFLLLIEQIKDSDDKLFLGLTDLKDVISELVNASITTDQTIDVLKSQSLDSFDEIKNNSICARLQDSEIKLILKELEKFEDLLIRTKGKVHDAISLCDKIPNIAERLEIIQNSVTDIKHIKDAIDKINPVIQSDIPIIRSGIDTLHKFYWIIGILFIIITTLFSVMKFTFDKQ